MVRPAVGAGAALALGIAVTAFQLIPFARRLAGMDLSYRLKSGGGGNLTTSGLVTAGVPHAFGSCPAQNYFGPPNEIELSVFVGTAALVLVLVALSIRRGRTPVGVRWFFVALVVVAAVLGYVGGPLLALAHHFPVFSNNNVGRIRVLIGFGCAVLAGIGYDALRRGLREARSARPLTRRHLAGVAALWTAAAVVAVLVIRWVHDNGVSAGRVHVANDALKQPVVVGVLAVVAVAAALVHRRGRWVAVVVLPVLVAVQGTAYAASFWPQIPRDEFYPRTPTHAFLDTHLGHDRYVAAGALFPGTNTFYGERATTGHAFTDEAWGRALQTIGPSVFASPTFTAFGDPAALSEGTLLLDRLAAAYLVTAVEQPVLGEEHPPPAADGTVALHAGTPLEVPIDPAALRAVIVTVATPLTTTGQTPSLRADIVDATTGDVLASGHRRLGRVFPAVGHEIPLPGEDLAGRPAGSLRLRLTLDAPGQTLLLAARGGAPTIGTVTATDDGLSLRVLRRLGDLPAHHRAPSLPLGPARRAGAQRRGRDRPHRPGAGAARHGRGPGPGRRGRTGPRDARRPRRCGRPDGGARRRPGQRLPRRR